MRKTASSYCSNNTWGSDQAGEMMKGGPFYLNVIDKPVSSVSYKNAINTTMKNVKENSPPKNLYPVVVDLYLNSVKNLQLYY